MDEYTKAFLKKNEAKVVKGLSASEVQCRVIDTSPASFGKAGDELRSGKLVAFPTETVYGLGANALDKEAVLSIYKAKGRPLSDPIIVHVLSASDILEFSILNDSEKRLVAFFEKTIWPGPLTMVVRANPKYISPVLTASTDFVGFRIPSHPIARKLIEESKVPIAAPSANIFGHVSPTSSLHVFNDFWNQPITLVDGGSSQWGVESSVIKCTVDESKNSLHIFVFRAGSLSLKTLQASLETSGLFSGGVFIQKKPKDHRVEDGVNTEAPGQILKHYAPKLPAFLLEHSRPPAKNEEPLSSSKENGIGLAGQKETKKAVLVDFAGKFLAIHEFFLKVFDLSEKGDYIEAMHDLYEVLRLAENIEEAEFIVVGDLSLSLVEEKETFKNDEFSETVYDKIFRCASGVKAIWDSETKKLHPIE